MTLARHRPAILVALLALLCCWVADIRAAAPLPASPTPHYVRDDAKWLGPGEFQALDGKLEAFEQETSSQFVVAIFPKIPDGEELFDFSQRLYESWKLGQADKDNGAIFLIFADDRKMRIHTGFGMEGVLPDARCKQIIQDIVAPQLRQGNREGAINAGVDAMIAAAKGEYTGTGKTRLDGSRQDDSGQELIFIILIVGLLAAKLIFRGNSGDRWYGGGGGFAGGGWGGGGSSGGGWGGGGGSGGGGFSGGGGDSGGGGASGSW